MKPEATYSEDIGDRSMPTPDPQVAPVPPGSEIAEAVRDAGKESPVPVISDTQSDPPMQFKSAADLTRALRSLGISKAAAKAITSGGWPALQKLTGVEDEKPDFDLGKLADALRAAADELRR